MRALSPTAQSCDGFVLVASVLKNERGDTQQVSNVGNLGSLSFLFSVETDCVVKGCLKPIRKREHC
jgi:hypothetical protein